MSSIPSAVEAYYNGFTFPVETFLEAMDSRPVYDRAGRTVKHTILDISIISYISSSVELGVTTDARMDTIKRELEQPAGQLILTGAGFGTLSVNAPGGAGQRDVVWGPKPTLLSCTHMGGQGMWKVRWRCEVAILNQCLAATYKGALMEFGYTVRYEGDRAGYGRRTYQGWLQIPQTRATVNSRVLSDNASNYIDGVLPAIPSGFVRTVKTWDLSADKCEAHFTVTDEMLPPNILPEGVVQGTFSHQIQCSGQDFMRWHGTMSAEFEPTWGKNPAATWKHFSRIFKDRLTATNKFTGRGSVIPVGLTIEETGTWERPRARFSLTYRYILDRQKLRQVISGSGLWRPIPGTDYNKWIASLNIANVTSLRSVANFQFSNGDDGIVDLCLTATPKVLRPEVNPFKSGVDAFSEDKNNPEANILDAFADVPPPADSFLDYKVGIKAFLQNNTVEMKPLPASPVLKSGGLVNVNDTGGFEPTYKPGSLPTSIVQYRGSPTIIVVLAGQAIRAGYDVTPPKLTSVGGVEAIPYGTGYFATAVTSNIGVPVVTAQWSLPYLLPALPVAPIGAPPSPIYGSPTGGSQLIT